MKRQSKYLTHPIMRGLRIYVVLSLDICRHLDFNTGNAIKYLLRKDKVDGNKTKTEKRIEDLRKAVFYIQDEIKLLEHGTD